MTHVHEFVNYDGGDGLPVHNDPVCRSCGVHPEVDVGRVPIIPSGVWTLPHGAYINRGWEPIVREKLQAATDAGLTEATVDGWTMTYEAWPTPDPFRAPATDDEPWPLYPVTPPRHIPWRWLALALVLLIAWRIRNHG